MKHHDFGPSSLERYRICPGSYVMQKDIPETTSAAAEEGTMLHNAVATKDLDGLNPEQELSVTKCLDFVATLVEPGDELYHELELELRDPDTGELLTFGTSDVVIVKPERQTIVVIDWKFGYTPVKDVSNNIQLATYCAMAMQKFGFASCTGYVFQPRIGKRSSYTFTNLDAIISNVKNIIAKATSDTMVLRATEESCRYCRARLNCPAFRVNFQKLAATKGSYNLEDIETLVSLYEASLDVKAFIKEIETAVKDNIEKNGSCGDYIFEYKDGNREVKDISGLYAVVKDYLTTGEFHAACKVTIGKLESALSEKLIAEAAISGVKLSKTDAKKKCSEMLAPLITRGTPTRTIVAR